MSMSVGVEDKKSALHKDYQIVSDLFLTHSLVTAQYFVYLIANCYSLFVLNAEINSLIWHHQKEMSSRDGKIHC